MRIDQVHINLGDASPLIVSALLAAIAPRSGPDSVQKQPTAAAPAAAVPESPSMFANRKDFDAAVGASPEPDSWSGWACQYPGRLPRLYGARHIAEVNLDEENGDRLLFLKEVPND